MNPMKKIFLLALASGFVAHSAFAFPEMVRAGYTNCISCHVSPNGGGVLSQYGRQSSATVLSTWGTEKEAVPFYGLFKQPDWIDTGAFIKGVQTVSNNSSVSNGYYWWMEADVEGAASFGKDKRWTTDLAVGLSPDVLNGLQVPGNSPGIMRRAYAMYRVDDYTTVRAGKYIADYGVYFPDHRSRHAKELDLMREWKPTILSTATRATNSRAQSPRILDESMIRSWISIKASQRPGRTL